MGVADAVPYTQSEEMISKLPTSELIQIERRHIIDQKTISVLELQLSR